MALENQHEFWSWFASRAKEFRTAPEDEMQLIVQHISERVKLVHEDLACEFALNGGHLGELVISGDGMRDLIPIVTSFVEAAPQIEGWKITAFRPRLDQYGDMELKIAGHLFCPKTIWFELITDDGFFDVVFYHFDFDEENSGLMINGTYILLDMAVGELDVMTRIRYIDHRPLSGDPAEQGLFNFTEFRTIFDRFHEGH